MPFIRILLILFISVPLLELYLLIKAGSVIGVLPTILLCILTAALGAVLLRLQGLQTIANIQMKLEQRQLPAADLLGGAMLLFAGALLLTPGFITDAIGFLCLIPRFRRKTANHLLLRILKNRMGMENAGDRVTVEGEFWSENQNRNDKKLR